jgi:hypothetical protein
MRETGFPTDARSGVGMREVEKDGFGCEMRDVTADVRDRKERMMDAGNW